MFGVCPILGLSYLKNDFVFSYLRSREAIQPRSSIFPLRTIITFWPWETREARFSLERNIPVQTSEEQMVLPQLSFKLNN